MWCLQVVLTQREVTSKATQQQLSAQVGQLCDCSTLMQMHTRQHTCCEQLCQPDMGHYCDEAIMPA